MIFRTSHALRVLTLGIFAVLFSACGGGSSGSINSSSSSSVQNYTVGGTITGLSTSGLTLSLTGSKTETFSPASGATSFTFSQGLISGNSYTVAISAQPTGQTCSIIGANSATGVISTSNITIGIACSSISTISGTASKGTLKNAIVTAYSVSADGKKAGKLKDTRTDNSGYYTLSIVDYNGPVLLELTSDSITRMVCDIPSGCDGSPFKSEVTTNINLLTAIPSLVAGENRNTAITPFTHLAIQRALASSSGLTKEAIEKNLLQIASLFNLPPLNETKPSDITLASTKTESEDAQRYATLNAAIGQLSGSLSQLNNKLDELITTLNNNNGQLKVISSNSSELDLENVISAADSIATSPLVSSNVSSLIISIINQDLETAKATKPDTFTTASSSPLAGADDLTKAKSFAKSAHDMINTIRTIDGDGSLKQQLENRYQPISDFFNGAGSDEIELLSEANRAAMIVAREALKLCVNQACTQDLIDTNINNTTKMQQILEDEFNIPYGHLDDFYSIKTIASINSTDLAGKAPLRITASPSGATNKLTLNGYIKIKRGIAPTYTSDSESVYQLQEFSFTFASYNSSLNTQTMNILQGSKIITPHVTLSIAANSSLTVELSTPVTINGFNSIFNSFQLSDGTDWSNMPTKATFDFPETKLEVKDDSNHTASFTGKIKWVLNKVELPNSADLSKTYTFALPSLFYLSGSFTGLSNDSLTASVTITPENRSNPLLSPAQGYERPGLFVYNFDASTNTATFRPSSSVVVEPNWWAPGTYDYVLTLQSTNCSWNSNYQNKLTYKSPQGWEHSICTDKTTAYDALNEVFSSTYMGWSDCYSYPYRYIDSSTGQWVYDWPATYLCQHRNDLSWYKESFKWKEIEIVNEGSYQLDLSAITSLGTTTKSFAGIKNSDNDLYEDSTHFASGSASLDATLNLTVNDKPQTATIRLDAKRDAFTGGSGTLKITLNGQTLTLTTKVVDRVATYTLSDTNGVSIEAIPNADQESIALMVNGKQMGTVFTLSGLPVAKFVDNTLMAL